MLSVTTNVNILFQEGNTVRICRAECNVVFILKESLGRFSREEVEDEAETYGDAREAPGPTTLAQRPS